MKETYIPATPGDLLVGGTSITKGQGPDWGQGSKALVSMSMSVWGCSDHSEGSVGPWAHDLSPPMNIRNSHREKKYRVYYRLHSGPPKRYVEVLTLGTCKCGLIRK